MSSSRSFLDDLLSNDLEKPINTSRRKSVRFIDENDNNGHNSNSNSMQSSLNREKDSVFSEGLDIINNSSIDGNASKQSQTQKNTAKSDWLGLNNDQLNDIPITQTASQKSHLPEKTDDWLTQGLRDRKNRPQSNTTTSTSSETPKSTETIAKHNNSWLSIKQKVEHKDEDNEKDFSQSHTQSREPEIIEKQIIAAIKQNESHASNQQNSSVMLLQTQVRMLELEKNYLQQTLDQMKTNHNNELKIMTDLHEQQMRMTIEMYKKHEQMLQEERDRRISEFKTQLNQSETDIDDQRRRYNERTQYIENEWHNEVERLKQINANTIIKLTEQHEHDLTRVRKIKELEIESVNALQNHGESVDSLVTKWEQSAQQIQDLHRTVIEKQEQILKEKFTDIEFKNRNIENIEINWRSLVDELERERSKFNEQQIKLSDIIEEQKRILYNEQKRINEERNQIESEKRKLEEDRQRFVIDCQYSEDTLKKERHILSEETIKFKEEKSQLTIEQNKFNLKETESKLNLQKERDELKKILIEIEDKRNDIYKEQSVLQQFNMKLQNEQHNFEQRKILFDVEKVKMQELALEIAKRAEELEDLSEIALYEKREGNMAMDEAEKFKKELDGKLDFIETSFAQIRSDQENISKEKKKIEEQWRNIKQTKDNLVCNLCASSLAKVKYNTSLPQFNTFSTLYTASEQFAGIQEADRTLLLWQISGQHDQALLAEETAFVNALQRTSGISFHNNDHYLN